MQSLLQKACDTDVILEPFPHIVLQDPIDDALCFQLLQEIPSINQAARGKELLSNHRLNINYSDIVDDRVQVSPLWREFLTAHVTQNFLNHVIQLFQKSVYVTYPWFEKKFGSLDAFRAGIRNIDRFSNADLLMDALISYNGPVFGFPSSARRAHVDNADKLFVGLFYMRHPDDDSTGSDLELYRYKNGKPYGFNISEIDDKYVEVVKTIPYRRNILIYFINSIQSLHGVTVCLVTPWPRYFVNLVGEVKSPLFPIARYQELSFLLQQLMPC